jgi:hypothetical protein
MSTSATIVMVIAAVTLIGGLGASIAVAVRAARRERPRPGN